MDPFFLIVCIMLAIFMTIPTVVLFRILTRKVVAQTATLVAISLVLVSCAVFILGLFCKPILGPDYSPRRFTTIWVNLLLNFGIIVMVLVRKWRGSREVAIAGAFGVLAWFYLAGVSSVV